MSLILGRGECKAHLHTVAEGVGSALLAPDWGAESWLTALHVIQTSKSRTCFQDCILAGSAWVPHHSASCASPAIARSVPLNACCCSSCSCSLCLGNPRAERALTNPCQAMGIFIVSSLISLQMPFSFACWDFNPQSPQSTGC